MPVGYVNVNSIPTDLSYFASLGMLDQLNIMSYGAAGVWQGWKSWHSSALYQQDSATPTSIDSSVQAYVAAGVPKAKLGIGIGAYGLCYTPPVSGPDQDLPDGAAIAASDGTMSYAVIMQSYYTQSARQWDSLARVPYLSFTTATGPKGCGYISYDDDQSIAEKAAYVKAQGLGGVIMWEINEEYMPSANPTSPLLDSVGRHLLQ
jgi:chitinase